MKTFTNTSDRSNKSSFKQAVVPALYLIAAVIITIYSFMEINTITGVIALILSIVGAIFIFTNMAKTQGSLVGSYVLDEKEKILYYVLPILDSTVKDAKSLLRPHTVSAIQNVKKYEKDRERLNDQEILIELVDAYKNNPGTLEQKMKDLGFKVQINELKNPQVLEEKGDNFVISFNDKKGREKTKEISIDYSNLKDSIRNL